MHRRCDRAGLRAARPGILCWWVPGNSEGRTRGLCVVGNRDDDELMDEAVGKMFRASAAGVLLAVPVIIMVTLGAPVWVTTGFLVLVIAVATPYVVRRRRR